MMKFDNGGWLKGKFKNELFISGEGSIVNPFVEGNSEEKVIPMDGKFADLIFEKLN